MHMEVKKQTRFSRMTFFYAGWMAALMCAAFASHAAEITGVPSVVFTNATQAVIRWSTDVSTGSRVLRSTNS